MLYDYKQPTNSIGGFEMDVRSYFSRKIKLPKMDSYPIEYLSQTKVDFLKALREHPELETVFSKLHHLQIACSETRLISWQSTCIIRKLNRKTAYVQVVFSCYKGKQEEAEELIDSLDLFC